MNGADSAPFRGERIFAARWRFFSLACHRGRRLEGEDPRAVFGLIPGVQSLVTRRARRPHYYADFEPALAEVAEADRVRLAACAVRLIAGLCPRAAFPAQIRP